MKKVLIGLLMVIPLIIVGAVLLITEVVLLTPDIAVTGVEIVDEYQVAVESVEVENFRYGTQYQLFAQVTPRKANNRKVLWSVDVENATMFNPEFDGEIASVDENGLVTIYSTGTFDVVLTSDDGGFTDRCTFIVNSDVATSAYLVYDSKKSDDFNNVITMSIDDIFKLDACARPTDVDLEYVKWASSDESVLTVDANGVVVPKRQGKAVVTMTLKSKNKTDANGNVTKYATDLTDTVEITVTGGVFKVSSYNYCVDPVYETVGENLVLVPARLALSTLGAEGATLVDAESTGCHIDGTDLVFENASLGKAVLQKSGKTITVRQYKKNSIVFENADKINNDSIMMGKTPISLKCVSAETGAVVEDAYYKSSNENVATIGARDGKITAVAEGEVYFTAKNSDGEECSIHFTVKEPVLYFKLAQDTYLGIARERIYGNKWYNSNYELTNTRESLRIIQPKDISNTRFTWSVDEANRGVVSIDETGALTIDDFDGERKITITIAAKDSPYTYDKIQSTYTFTVRKGVNVTNENQIVKAADEKLYDIFMQSDIQFRNDSNTWQLRVYTNFYGNGQLLYWRHIDGGEKSVEGADILEMHGDDTVLRNIRIQSSQLPDNGKMTSSSFGRKCLETYGNNLKIQFCQFENAQYCAQVSSYNSTYEGCVFSNTSKFGLFCWATRENQYCTVKNCIFGQSAAPSIGFSGGSYEEHTPNATCTLNFEGFCYIYNWKQNMEMDLIGEITHNETTDNAIRSIVNTELSDKKYAKYFYESGGVTYMHCGMLLSGFEHKCNIILAGDVEKNGFNQFVIDFDEIGNGQLKRIINGGLNNCYMYGYYGDNIPVMPTDSYTLNDATCQMLREGDPNFGK